MPPSIGSASTYNNQAWCSKNNRRTITNTSSKIPKLITLLIYKTSYSIVENAYIHYKNQRKRFSNISNYKQYVEEEKNYHFFTPKYYGTQKKKW
ncbi:MAG: hypothetical protein AB8B66_00780 [Rickettsiaceae bacterium]